MPWWSKPAHRDDENAVTSRLRAATGRAASWRRRGMTQLHHTVGYFPVKIDRDPISMSDMTSNTPDRSRARFPGISSRAYEHPADRSALVALRSLTGFDTVLLKMAGLFSERAIRLMYLGGSVRVTENQFRNLHDMVRDAAYILDLPEA